MNFFDELLLPDGRASLVPVNYQPTD